jgi:hypothetical protein
MTTLIPKYHAFTQAQLLAAPAYGGGGASLPEPAEGYGLNFTNTDSAGNERIYASIQGETKDNTANANNGQLNVLVTDGDFLQTISAWTYNGSFVTGPGQGAYLLDICGLMPINGVTANFPYFGERLSAVELDNEDARVIAARNCKFTNLTNLGNRVGIGFSILNTAGKEVNTATLRAQYKTRTATVENSYMYPATLVNGTETNGPYFYNGGIGFQQTALEANRLGAYEVGTWTPVFSGASGAITGTCTTGPTGNYVLIGKQLFISFYGLMNSPSGYPTGQVNVSGLPFAIKNGATGNYQSITPNYTIYGTAPTSVTTHWQASGATQLLLYSGTNWGSSGAIELGGSGVIQLA